MESAFNRKRRKRRPKVCHFCVDKVEHIDYKDIDNRAIKRARLIALLPFTSD